jgi:hypothetical protein
MTRYFKIIIGLLTVGACVAVPFMVYHRDLSRIQKLNESLRVQTTQLTQSVAENKRLSNDIAQTSAVSSSELAELLGLRAQVGRLREQTNVIQKLQTENQRLLVRSTIAPHAYASMSDAERNAELSAETVQAMKNILAALPAAMQAFADQHTGKWPINMSELRDYFSTTNGERLVGLYTFEFARGSGPRHGDALILREYPGRSTTDGRRARVYGFSDGTVVERVATDADSEFWERYHFTSEPQDSDLRSDISKEPAQQ